VLGDVHRELGLSARGYLSVLRVARTIADLAGQDSIAVEHVAEAAAYRTRRKQPAG
jgi:magnesium chelatase family protein